MAHWAELDDDNKVLRVVVTDNNDPNNDEGYKMLTESLGGIWIKTSYTSRGGNKINPNTGEVELVGSSFRKNYAGFGYTYDEERDAFIPPKPYESWILDEDSCLWKPIVEKPNDGLFYKWNEESQSWDLVN
jgi:hypothetical protein